MNMSTATETTSDVAAFYQLLADYPAETLRQVYDPGAPLPYAIWLDVDGAEDIIGAAGSLGAAVVEARGQLEAWA